MSNLETNKIALITGITGQDGSYLTEFLLEKDYFVWGIIRRSSNFNTQRIDHLFHNEKLILRFGDLADSGCISNILTEIKNIYTEDLIERFEIYNLGAMSHVKVSFEIPEYSGNIDGLGTLRILEAIRSSNMIKKIRFYQASTSELYGKVQEIPQTETTPFYPRSPYAVAKLYAYWIVKNYREAYGLFACNGILFNHESERRGPTFVTKKITRELNKIVNGEIQYITLGNINSKRDWGHAKDFVRGMWLMLQHDKPDDFVLATGESHSVKEFVEAAFNCKDINIKWCGEGINEVGYDSITAKKRIIISEKYFRPTEVEELIGDYSKAKRELNWEPKISFEELVEEMVKGRRSLSLQSLRLPLQPPNYVKENISEGQTLEEQTLEGQTLEEQTLEGQTLEGQTLEGQTLEGQTLEGQTLEKEILEKEILEKEILEKQTLEETIIEPLTTLNIVSSGFKGCSLINYITDFVCTYNLMDDFTESNPLYQVQLLQAFDLDIFDDKIINKITKNLFEKYKKNTYIIKIIASTNKNMIDDELTLFRMCFGYHTFHLFHSILCSLINETPVNEDKFQKLIRGDPFNPL